MHADRRRLFISVLVSAIILGSLLLFPTGAIGITSEITPGASSYLLGSDVELNGSVVFDANEFRRLTSVQLTIDGPQPCTASLPLVEGSGQTVACSPSGSGTLTVSVTFNNVIITDGFGYGYGYGDGFLGQVQDASIDYQILWHAPIWLDPAPVFTLLPQTAPLFDIPVIVPPTPDPSLPDPLPTVTPHLPIPQLNSLPQGAPDPLPTLTALPNPIPLATTPDPNAPDELPTLTEVGDIPDASPPLPGGLQDPLPIVTPAFQVPQVAGGTTNIQGLAYDGANFYVLVDGQSPDKILKVDANGLLQADFGAGGVAEVPYGSTQVEGITYLNGALWIADNAVVNFTDPPFEPRIRKLNAATGAEVASFPRPFGDRATGLSVEGNALWIVGQGLCDFARMDQNGQVLQQFGSNRCNLDQAHSLEIGASLLTTQGGIIQTFDNNGNEKSTVSALGLDDIRGSVFAGNVFYMGNASDGTVYKGAFASGVTQNPLGLTYDGTNLWALVDNTLGNDKLLRLDPADASLLDTYEAPSSDTKGLAFLNDRVWILYNDGNNAKVQKFDPVVEANDGAPINLQNFFDSVGGITTDGASLFVANGNWGELRSFDTNGFEQNNLNLNSQTLQNGVNGLAYLAETSQFFGGKADAIAGFDSNGNEVSSFTNLQFNPSLNIRGMTFDGRVLYIADLATGKILKTFVPTGETTSPLGIALDGADGLWLLTNSTGGADKLLKLNSTTGALIASYDAPSGETQGLTYLSDFLWVVYKDSQNNLRFQKIDPATGQGVGQPVGPGQQGGGMEPGGLATDGTDLLVVARSWNEVRSYDPDTGQETGQSNLNSGELQNGAHGFTQRPGKGQYFAGRDDDIIGLDSDFNEIARLRFTSLQVNPNILVKGLAFDSSGTLYVADDRTDTVYVASIAPVVNHPRGLYANASSLYVLVDNEPNDSILKMDRVTGALDPAFGTGGVADAGSANAFSIVEMAGKLWVGYTQQSQFQGDIQKMAPFDPADGSSLAGGFSLQQGPQGDIAGLGTDGSLLYLGSSQQGDVRRFDANGSEVGGPRFFQEIQNGVTSMSVRVKDGVTELFGVRNDGLHKFDFDNQFEITDFGPLGISSIQGMGIVGDVIYFADDTTDTIWAAAIPEDPTVITQNPKAMATDGTGLYIVLDASPKDRLIKVDTDGNLVTNPFGTNGVAILPSSEIDALAFAGGSLWAIGNDEPPNCQGCNPEPKLYELNATTGAVEDSTLLPQQVVCCEPITGLADGGGGTLIGGFGGNPFGPGGSGEFVQIPTASPGNTQRLPQNPQQVPYMQDFGSVLFALNKAWAFSGNLLNGYDEQGGEMVGTVSFNLIGPSDVTGSAYIDTTLYMADDATNSVYGSTFQGNQPEKTTAGDYTAQLAASFNPTILSSVQAFSLVKATAVDVEITSPADNATVVTSPVTVTGTVDDPSIAVVSLGAQLATTTLFEDDAEGGQQSEDKFDVSSPTAGVGWHIDCDDKAFSDPCSWHYAKDVPGPGDYDTPGQPNSGKLKIQDVAVGQGTELSFYTWYNTEGGPDVDRKLIEVNIEGDDPDAGWMAIGQILPPGPGGFGGMPQPGNAHSSFQFIGIQPAKQNVQFGPFGPKFQPEWTPVHFDLTPFVGQTIDIRFKFDTVDSIFNQFEGWNIDDILIEGQGSAAGDTAPVVNGAFTAQFDLAEGGNDVTVKAVLPYDTSITDTDTITVNLDTTNPVVEIDQDTEPNAAVPDIITGADSVTVSGSFVEFNFASLIMTNTTEAGDIPVLTVSGTPPANDEFSEDVTLLEGNNLVTVVVTDGAGRTGTASVFIQKDSVGPTFTLLDTVYPVGVVDARPGDPLIFQLNADDAASDVLCVEVLFNPNTQQAPCQGGASQDVEPFMRPAEIPQAVRDAWGVTGEWLLPVRVPTGSLPGSFDLPVRIVDSALNETSTTVGAIVAPSLSAINIGLMPDENLISLPLIPNDREAGNLPRLLGSLTESPVIRGSSGSDSIAVEEISLPFGSSNTRAGVGDWNDDGLTDILGVVFEPNNEQFTSSLIEGGTTESGNNQNPHVFIEETSVTLGFASDRGDSQVDSFFDIFTEVSLDGGQTWGAAQQLTGVNGPAGVPEGENIQPHIVTDGQTTSVFFVSNRDGDSFFDVFVMGLDGSNPTNLCVGADNCPAAGTGRFWPVVAPDGSRLFFVSDEDGAGFFDVYAMNLDGTGVTKLIDTQMTVPFRVAVSPDSARLAFSDVSGSVDLFVAKTDGTDVRQITYQGYTDAALNPVWDDTDIVHFGATFGITLKRGIVQVEPWLFLLTDAIWRYDATLTSLPVEDRWTLFTPAVGNVDTLMDLKTGLGYWWLTDAAQFELSDPLEPGLPQTPKVENFAYNGVFLRKGAEAPPVYETVQGWNLIGLHSERPINTDEYLAALGRGDAATWSSLLRFDNFIDFPIGEEGEPRFELGHFTRVFVGEEMLPTQGFWLFSTADGVITP